MTRLHIKQLGQALIAYSVGEPVQWYDVASKKWKDLAPECVYGMAQMPNMRLRPKP